MATISLCMIVRNEEDTLERCLSSLANLADEIIIVDTGSTDETKSVAQRFTDRIYDFAWIEDFAAARNYAFSLARMDYILWLDADDIFRERDRRKLSAFKCTLDPTIDSVTMEYHLAFDEFGNVTARNRRNRLVKRANEFRWIGKVHEYLEVWGNIVNSDIAVTHASVQHDSDRNIRIYEAALARGESLSPRDLYYFANELKDHGRYLKAIDYYEKFLATGQGWIEDVLSSCGKMADCYHALDDTERELECTLCSFRYAAPRAEFCCRLGYYFLQRNEVDSSIFWYNVAANLDQPKENLGFTNVACSTWLPHLQLCVCYDRKGQHELAYAHNEMALRYRPHDERMLHNQQYLQNVLAEAKPVSMESVASVETK
ncbi:tetratricopeptide repeat-containing glycosyltransferase family 2 protein [Paenibacillus sp. OSY-SE]|uniref:tetratricopeptide repeat-containing glycosyltransferase family 2 protein n=1 Tax=Paenibacillus sp. OSY-SE TaxID=1196323 RepID=UPI0003156D09|nr:glycosyltransferase family 2 protein [Paenibacillus sp. OSY-SE]